jgi:hypothetical protein
MTKGMFFLLFVSLIVFVTSPVDSGSFIVCGQKQGDAEMSGGTNLEGQELARINAAVTQYLTQQKLWKLNQFRVDYKGVTADGRSAIVWAIYLEDETNPVPGGGKSLELQIDRTTMKVVKELGFQ